VSALDAQGPLGTVAVEIMFKDGRQLRLEAQLMGLLCRGAAAGRSGKAEPDAGGGGGRESLPTVASRILKQSTLGNREHLQRT
jgi:hypothetical protein